ncbi:hypothetical protein JCM19232_5002 [Vibrio ishigakensis]|uniref:Uncharacterized protein n=1 Tax=Vibrio ishigakensis TaxID=1481914 RepID=A0A0B8PLA6_9VIBR|nr:hypothetical protein JCM19232_5002 [Vibrio ishigakensis]
MNNTLSFQVIVDSKLSLEDYGLDELIPVAVSEQEFHRIQREIEEYLGIELEGGSSEGEHT